MSVELSPQAAKRVKNFLQNQGGLGMRFGVYRTGCSGYAYTTTIVDQIEDSDAVFETQGVTIVVDPKSLPLVDGTQIDFQKSGLSEGFVFKNPKSKSQCGCGESFELEPH